MGKVYIGSLKILILFLLIFIFPLKSQADTKSDLGLQFDKDTTMADKLTTDMTNSAYSIDQFKSIFQKCTTDFKASSSIYSSLAVNLDGAYKTSATESATIFSDVATQCANSVASIDSNDDTAAQKANDKIYSDFNNYNLAIDKYNEAYNAEVDIENKKTDDYNANLDGYTLLVTPLFAGVGIFALLSIIFLLLMIFSKSPESKGKKKNLLLSSLFATIGFAASWIWYANLALDQSYYYSLIPAAASIIYFIISIIMSIKNKPIENIQQPVVGENIVPQPTPAVVGSVPQSVQQPVAPVPQPASPTVTGPVSQSQVPVPQPTAVTQQPPAPPVASPQSQSVEQSPDKQMPPNGQAY